MLQDIFGKPITPFDPELYYSGFYEDYEFQKQRNYDSHSKCISCFLAVLSIFSTSFTVPVIQNSGNINRVYKRVIIEHIVISTIASMMFPVTGITVIANYRVAIMDPWFHCPIIAFIVAALIIYAYMTVVTLCVFSFLFNFVISTNLKINFWILRNFETENILRVGFKIYAVTTTILSAVIVFESLNFNTTDVLNATISYDPRLAQVFREKNVHILTITYGLLTYILFLSAVAVIFFFLSILIIFYNFRQVSRTTGNSSKQVKKQQKHIIRVEILYYFMILICYAPPEIVLFNSVVTRSLPESWERFPVIFLISIPLQLLPILDCLLHVLAIRGYRDTALQFLHRVFVPRMSAELNGNKAIIASIQLVKWDARRGTI